MVSLKLKRLLNEKKCIEWSRQHPRTRKFKQNRTLRDQSLNFNAPKICKITVACGICVSFDEPLLKTCVCVCVCVCVYVCVCVCVCVCVSPYSGRMGRSDSIRRGRWLRQQPQRQVVLSRWLGVQPMVAGRSGCHATGQSRSSHQSVRLLVPMTVFKPSQAKTHLITFHHFFCDCSSVSTRVVSNTREYRFQLR